MNRDIKKLAKWAESNGWAVVDDTKGYTRFHSPDGKFIAHYPATPRNPKRRMADLRTALKREGLQIPPPSKKELRSIRQKGVTND